VSREARIPEERLVFLTGISGAGKSAAMACLEDMGFYCADNVPTVLIPDFVRVVRERREQIPRVALVVDVRERVFLSEFLPAVERLRTEKPRPEVLFLECSDEVLLRRFSETKRPHPLALDTRALDGIKQERELLADIRNAADIIIDTTNFNHYQLRDHLMTVFQAGHKLVVSVVSFGYKFGIPLDSDLVFDVRFLRNPHYVPSLKPLTGESEAVERYVFEDEGAGRFFAMLVSFVKEMLPRYVREGKAYLNIGIGCTGGKHRSVAVAKRLAAELTSPDWKVSLTHRDCTK
jgi:UPF0042 nucleotide-binding protein